MKVEVKENKEQEKITKEEILDKNCKPAYGYDNSKEHGRIYSRKDILKAMQEYKDQ